MTTIHSCIFPKFKQCFGGILALKIKIKLISVVFVYLFTCSKLSSNKVWNFIVNMVFFSFTIS